MSASSALTNGLKAVIFDLDGVVFDSLSANVAYYNHILTAVGCEPRAGEALEVIHRDPTDVSLRHLLGQGPEFERAWEYARRMDLSPFLELLNLNPLAEATIAALSRRYTLAVATNRTSTARRSLDRFGLLDLFAEVVTPLDTGAPKPHPAIMELLLTRLGLMRQEVIYVGDTSVDEALAQACGVRLIAFANPGLSAWAHVGDFASLSRLFGI